MAKAMHPNEALEYIRAQTNPEWAIINFREENPDGECWKIFLSAESDSTWNQVFKHGFLRLDWALKCMYDNGLPVTAIPMGIDNWN